MTINLKKIFILIFALFLGFVSARADGAYKNELTKVTLSPIGASDVKVTLFMTKPYTEPLRLLKKNDGEFVLILPETFNSAPQKPSISDVIGEVTDADIKLYSFVANSAQNGYTKIVIKTNGLVNLYPEAVTVGGGHVVNKPKEEINKIVYEQVKPVNTTPVAPVQNTTVTQAPKAKENVESKKVDAASKDVKQTKNQVSAPQKQEPAPKIAATTETVELPVVNLPNIETINRSVQTDVPLEEISFNDIADKEESTLGQTGKVSIFSLIKDKLSKFAPQIKTNVSDNSSSSGNILVTIVSLLLISFAVKFGISVIKDAKSKQEDPFDNLNFEKQPEKDKEKAEYSEFFKTLISSEVKGNNPFTIETPSIKQVMQAPVVEPAKSHEEVLNIDQNLTWQEKFRALQKNKKALLNANEEHKTDMEIRSDMHIENPIKKLKQDFKAVKKVLERQKARTGETSPLEKEFTPEKLEKIEVISFEDFQKNVERPKVQINKTIPLKTKAPKVLTQLQLGEQKGLYLVEYKDKISLIGYINDKVFKLNSYSSVRDTKMYARLSEKNNDNETYIVKFDNNKMLVDINDEQMKLKLMY